MRTTICLLSLLFVLPVAPVAPVAGAASIGPPTDELLDLNVTSESHPEEDRVVLYRGIDLSFDTEGRLTRRVRVVSRLLTDLAIEHYGDERVAYDTTRQELSIDVCRTFMVDGLEVPAKPRVFNRVTPDRVAFCPDRADLQEMVISHLGVERGCLIELEYSLRDLAVWRPWLEGIERLGSEDAILSGEVRISAPGKIKAAVVGSPPGLQETESPKRWTYGPMPGIPNERGLAESERIPYLVYSTCESWDQLSNRLLERIDASSVPDDAIKRWVDEPMPSGRPPLNDEERLSRAGWLTGDRTNSADNSPSDWWLRPRSAERTFDTSCGNLLDRAALAVAALRAWQIPFRVGLLPSAPQAVREVPALVQFNDIWLMAADRYLSVDRGVASAAPDPGYAEELFVLALQWPAFEPLAKRVAKSSLTVRLKEDEDGSVKGEAALRVGGAIVRSLGCHDIKGFLDGLAGDLVTDGAVAGYEVHALGEDTLAVTLSLTGGRLGEVVGDSRIRLAVPFAPGMPEAALPSESVLRRPDRQTPLSLPYSLDETVELRIELPAAGKFIIVPEEERLEAAGAHLTTTVDRNGEESLRINRRMSIEKRSISPDSYPSFRDLVLRRLASSSNSIYIETVEGAD